MKENRTPKTDPAIEFFWDDGALAEFFAQDVKGLFPKFPIVEKATPSKTEDGNPLRKAIKKPMNQKGMKGQGLYNAKNRAAAYF